MRHLSQNLNSWICISSSSSLLGALAGSKSGNDLLGFISSPDIDSLLIFNQVTDLKCCRDISDRIVENNEHF